MVPHWLSMSRFVSFLLLVYNTMTSFSSALQRLQRLCPVQILIREERLRPRCRGISWSSTWTASLLRSSMSTAPLHIRQRLVQPVAGATPPHAHAPAHHRSPTLIKITTAAQAFEKQSR
ncbi:hypothetical protein CEXT_723101 [Caerostris extrusa]|uniref:Secreted protein n=1 Tax=Caerostris extrusa TaxID=172846 RepID=A0AAV4XF54_CAEEX|nr:hypothetical protein CEXT_723101 [Caerostris extrusa]